MLLIIISVAQGRGIVSEVVWTFAPSRNRSICIIFGDEACNTVVRGTVVGVARPPLCIEGYDGISFDALHFFFYMLGDNLFGPYRIRPIGQLRVLVIQPIASVTIPVISIALSGHRGIGARNPRMRTSTTRAAPEVSPRRRHDSKNSSFRVAPSP